MDTPIEDYKSERVPEQVPLATSETAESQKKFNWVGLACALAQITCWIGVVAGVWIAAHNYFINDILSDQAKAAAQAMHQSGWSYFPVPPQDRLVGVVFGLGLSIVCTHLLSVLLRNRK